jgi:hypothetical protein
MVAAKLDSSVSQTGTSSFFSFRTKESLKYYYARDGSGTTLVSSKPHIQPKEEDLVDEGAKDDGRSDQGER